MSNDQQLDKQALQAIVLDEAALDKADAAYMKHDSLYCAIQAYLAATYPANASTENNCCKALDILHAIIVNCEGGHPLSEANYTWAKTFLEEAANAPEHVVTNDLIAASAELADVVDAFRRDMALRHNDYIFSISGKTYSVSQLDGLMRKIAQYKSKPKHVVTMDVAQILKNNDIICDDLEGVTKAVQAGIKRYLKTWLKAVLQLDGIKFHVKEKEND
ncbi:MAG: hypothetical protein EPO08_20805 [Rhodospirillaceae bacterium]|nr:MAG: hypothetical protein EPO08_20805 [Rhodospirillaceae bacterium]